MTQSLPLLIITRRFTIPDELVPGLRELQAQSRQQLYTDRITEAEDAIVMTLGMGAAMYLTLDGRIIIDEDDLWLEKTEPPRQAKDEKEMFAAVIIGARRRNAPELLSLLPPRPDNACSCQDCAGNGWRQFGIDTDGNPVEIICMSCGGIGWIMSD